MMPPHHQVFAFVHEAMSVLSDLPNQTVESMLKLALRTGEVNLKVGRWYLVGGGKSSTSRSGPEVGATGSSSSIAER